MDLDQELKELNKRAVFTSISASDQGGVEVTIRISDFMKDKAITEINEFLYMIGYPPEDFKDEYGRDMLAHIIIQIGLVCATKELGDHKVPAPLVTELEEILGLEH